MEIDANGTMLSGNLNTPNSCILTGDNLTLPEGLVKVVRATSLDSNKQTRSDRRGLTETETTLLV